MHPSKSCPADRNEVALDLYPFIRKYKDGHVKRFLRSSFVPASEDLAASRGVATRDVVIDKGSGLSARLFLPSRAAAAGQRLPLIMYIHGGSFCTESAFCRTYHNYVKSLAACSGALIVSVEYRLAPEHSMPTAYDDTWAAFRWVAALSDPWIADYADPSRTFLAGDSAGGNIVYHTAVRASRDDNLMGIEGLVIVHPYFWGPDRLASEEVWDGVAMFTPEMVDRVWPFVTAGKAGNDDPCINPHYEEIASLTCRRVLVAVAEKDILRDRGRQLAARMRDCIWTGDNVTLVESKGEDHGFHLYNPLRATSKKLMESIVQFINQRPSSPPPMTSAGEMDSGQPTIGIPTRLYAHIFGYGMAMKVWSGPVSMIHSSLQIERGIASRTTYGLFLGSRRPNKANRCSLSLTVGESSIIRNFF